MRKFSLAVASLVFVLLSAGCNRHSADASVQSPEQPFNGVQFCQDFASAPPELKAPADKAWRSVQSGAFADALKCLGTLAANPSLNAAQKKSVTALTEQVKKQMAAGSTAR